MPRPKKKLNHGKYHEIKRTVGHKMDGTPIRKSFYSAIGEADAVRQYDDYKAQQLEARLAGSILDDDMTFTAWGRVCLEKYIRGSVRNNTYRNNYEDAFNNHLVPYFGRAKLSAILPLDIIDYFKKMREKGYALSTMEKDRVCLNAIFDTALENNLIYKNPISKRLNLVSDKEVSEKKTWTKEQRDSAIEFARAHKDGLQFIILVSGGLSRSEFLGLEWEYVDWENNTLEIAHGVTATRNPDTRKREITIDKPKNDFRERTIPFPDEVFDLLREKYKNRAVVVGANKHKNRPGTAVIPRFIFCNVKGEAYDPDNWVSRVYNPLMDDIVVALEEKFPGLPRLTPHELRHTFTTLAKEETNDLMTLARILGHADLRMMYKTYNHTSVDEMKKVLKIPGAKDAK